MRMSEMEEKKRRGGDESDHIIFGNVDKSTLIETRESDRCNCSDFELFIEETFEDKLSEPLCIGSSIEEITEDHVLDEFDSRSSCMPFGT